jgi:hypothetical protein
MGPILSDGWQNIAIALIDPCEGVLSVMASGC